MQKRWVRGWMVAGLVAACVTSGVASAEKAVASKLSTNEAQSFIATWKLELEVMQRKLNLFLAIVDVDGKVGATLDSERQPEALAIADISKNPEGGLDLAGELSFGPNFKLNINIALKLDGDKLAGRIKDKGGIFDAPLTGTKMSAEEITAVQQNRPSGTEARANYDGKRIRIPFADLKKGGADWELFQKVADGKVFMFTLSRATKMYTDLDLKFGSVVVKKENVAPNYPGVYSLWMKKAGSGWKLVFNSQPDIWGTRHLDEFDVGEVALTESKITGPAADKFKVDLVPNPTGGTLRLSWGDTKWETNYEVVK